MTITADDPFLGRCTISRDGFHDAMYDYPASESCLAERNPGQYWDECRAWGVDPLFVLAMFRVESSMGTAGTAVETWSWGNTRDPSFGAVPIDQVVGRSGVFPAFASWLDGCAATCARLASPVWPVGAPYGERTTIRAVFDDPELGPFKLLPGTWVNPPDSIPRGWNLIALPFPVPVARPGQEPPPSGKRPGFRLLGAGLVHAPGFLGNSDGAVWVTTFGTRR